MPNVQELINMGYGGYRGWGDPEAEADFRATGGRGKEERSSSPSFSQSSYSSSVPSTQSVIDTAKQLRQFNVESNQPYIQKLEASKAPLQERYKTLLDEITSREKKATERETTRISREYGQRGISTQSDVFQKQLSESLQDVSDPFALQKRQTLSQQDVALSELANLIGQLQTGDTAGATSNALSLYNAQQQAQENALTRALQQRRYEEVTLPTSQANIRNVESEIAKRGKDSNFTTLEMLALQKLLGGTIQEEQTPKPTPSFTPDPPESPSGKRGGFFNNYYG